MNSSKYNKTITAIKTLYYTTTRYETENQPPKGPRELTSSKCMATHVLCDQ